MRVGSLFSGIGGFDLAFERAGFEVVWQCEIDQHASAVLARHWPTVRQIGDVRDITAADGPVDVLVGGFPCQDLSVAGRRAGLAGERSGLFFEFARCIEALGPEWVVIENVPGLLSSNGGRDMAAVVGTLGALGYGWAYRVLDAQYFGLAQRRKRVFVVGCSGGRTRRAAEVLFEPESVCRDSPPSRTAGEGVAGTLGESAQKTGGFRATDLRGADSGSNRSVRVAAFDERNITSKGNRTRVEAGTPALTLHPGGQAVVISGEGSSLAPTVSAKWHKGSGGPSGDECQNLLVFIPGVVGTLLAGGQGGGGLNGQDAHTGRRFAPCGSVRRLTPRECERLQGFPDDWTAGQADSHRYRQLGNVVAVPVVEWIARRISREGTA